MVALNGFMHVIVICIRCSNMYEVLCIHSFDSSSYFMLVIQKGHTDDIITNIFQYINLLKKTGPQEWIFNEIKVSFVIGYHFATKVNVINGFPIPVCNSFHNSSIISSYLAALRIKCTSIFSNSFCSSVKQLWPFSIGSAKADEKDDRVF